MNAGRQEIIQSYRSLYRHALRAIQYASPARYTVKTLIGSAYRNGKATDYDIKKINNTLVFLEGAAKEKGLEHRILKNLLHTWWWQAKHNRPWKDQSVKNAQQKRHLSLSTINHFEITLKMLNETMDMCLPTTLTVLAGRSHTAASGTKEMESIPEQESYTTDLDAIPQIGTDTP